MGKEKPMRARHLWIVAVTLALAAPAFAADPVIQSGIDLWQTKADGRTYAKFDKNPIPAGFFCPKSERFTGQVVFQGVPIVTANAADLRGADTIVHRLDDAVFNKRGIATTRIQLRAMTFQSVKPLQTACGAFNATLRLDGEQPITRMRIVRESEDGGRFSAPIWANVKIAFAPVGRPTTEVFELPLQVRFPPLRNQRWTSPPQGPRSIAKAAFVTVDTDGDRVADTSIPGTSNFLAGFSSPTLDNVRQPFCHIGGPDNPIIWCDDCHADECGQHCPDGIRPW
jgi:hypothetical protein